MIDLYTNEQGPMSYGIISKLKRLFVEPNVYAVLMSSRRGAVLHLGVHFSLDEAVAAAEPAVKTMQNYRPGDQINIDMYTILKGTDVVKALLLPEAMKQETLAEVVPSAMAQKTAIPLTARIAEIKEAKNALMKDLIAKGDLAAVEETKGILNKKECALVSAQIEKRHEKTK